MGLSKKAAMVATVAAAGAVVAATPLLVPLGVGMLGFGAGGIAAGSWAAGLMSSYGGMVSAGSLCAVLQSVGAGGLATTTIVATEGVAAALAGLAAGLSLIKRSSAPADARPDAPAPAPTDVEEEEEMVVEEPDYHASSTSSPEAAPLIDNPFAQDPSALKQ